MDAHAFIVYGRAVIFRRIDMEYRGKKEEEKIQRIYDTYKTEEEPAADGEKEKEEELER